MRSRHTSAAFIATLAVVFASCCIGPVGRKHFKAVTFDSHDQAGSGHVAVLSVSEWSSYVRDYLQPEFELSTKQALEQAVPTSFTLERKLLDLTRAAASLALPTSAVSKTVEKTSSEAKGVAESATKTTKTREEGPGQLREIPNTLPGDRNAAALPGDSPFDEDLALDPITRHRAATAILQEVQLLNHYVEDMVVRNGYEPYVVRLQVSLMPSARNAPYDTYTTVCFFQGRRSSRKPSEENPPQGAGASLPPPYVPLFANLDEFESEIEPVRKYLGGIGDSTLVKTLDWELEGLGELVLEPNIGNLIDAQRSLKQVSESLEGRDSTDKAEVALQNVRGKIESGLELAREYFPRTPIIVPLLVADSLESASIAGTTNVARQFALALSAMIEGIGLGTGFENVRDELISSSGQDLNGLHLVSRLTENSLRVRFGARNQGTSRWAMVPQAQNVTLVVLVPRYKMDEQKEKQDGLTPEEGDDHIRVIARTEFVHAETGRPLPGRKVKDYERQRELVFRASRGLCGIDDPDEQQKLTEFVVSNDFSGFARELATSRNGAAYAEQAWIELTDLFAGSQFSSTAFSLPRNDDFELSGSSETLTVIDDGDKEALVDLTDEDLSKVKEHQVRARLVVGETEFTLPARSLSLDRARGRLRVAFPSLYKLMLPLGDPPKMTTVAAYAEGGTSMELFVSIHPVSKHPGKDCGKYAIRLAKALKTAPTPKAGHEITTVGAVAVQRGGSGKLPVELKLEKALEPGQSITVTLAFKDVDKKPGPGRIDSISVITSGYKAEPPGIVSATIKSSATNKDKSLRIDLTLADLRGPGELTLTTRVGKLTKKVTSLNLLPAPTPTPVVPPASQ